MTRIFDKTFCASPHCTNECGFRMSKEERKTLHSHPDYPNVIVSYAYMCGDAPTEEDLMSLISEEKVKRAKAILQELVDEAQENDMGY